MVYDTIIVGGGSAGSVLANRLSARSSHQVLLCEAGQDTPHGQVPPEILDSYPGTVYFDPRFHWNELRVHTQVVPQQCAGDSRAAAAQIRAGAGAGRRFLDQWPARQPWRALADYDEWEQRGAAGWNWDDVLPYFRKVERDMDFAGPYHGKEGRIPVRRIFKDLWTRTPRPRPCLRGGRLPLPARPERRVPRRAISPSPSPTPMTGASRRPSAISTRRRGSGTT